MSDEAFALDDELLQGFISESREHLATIEADLLAIEQAGDAADAELVNKVFRAAHSIKGCSGFLGLNQVKELAHKAETVLDMLRSHKICPNAEVTNNKRQRPSATAEHPCVIFVEFKRPLS